MIFSFKNFSNRSRLVAAIFVALSTAPAIAQSTTPDVTNLDRVEVTAVRHAQTVDDALASVTVIDREQIEHSPAVDLIGLLAQQAGVDVSRTGGAGQSSSVFLRGANSNQTLVLIDGVRVASTGQGVFDFAHLPLDQIQRIEIVRGPRAAFWGSDAIGGVLQIFTRKPGQLVVRAQAGSYGTYGGSVSVGTPQDRDSRIGVTLGDSRARGFSATYPDPGNPFSSYNPDDDGYRNRNFSVRGSTPLGSQTLGLTAIHTNANVEFDSGPSLGNDPTRTLARNSSGGLSLSGPLTDHWSHSLVLGGAREDLDTPVYGSQSRSRRTSLDWVNTLSGVGGGALTFGGNWQRENGNSISAYSVNPSGVEYARSTTNTAAFLGYGAHFGAHQIELAVRHDRNSQFGSATTGNAAWGSQIAPATRIRASWGQGFRAPSFNELYSPGFFGSFAGNPDLQPERSRSFEAGLEFKPSAAHAFTLSAWKTRVNQLIAFDGANFQAINVAHAELNGAELGYRFTAGGWSAGLAATVQDPHNADTGADLLRRPKRKLASDVRYSFGNGWDVAVDALTTSARADFDRRLPGYALVNVALGWNVNPSLRLEGRLGNLLDADYTLASGYNTAGRNVMFSLVWQPLRE